MMLTNTRLLAARAQQVRSNRQRIFRGSLMHMTAVTETTMAAVLHRARDDSCERNSFHTL
jgi:hypothetical protein